MALAVVVSMLSSYLVDNYIWDVHIAGLKSEKKSVKTLQPH